MRFKINLSSILLILVIILAFAIRVYRLSDIPSGFFTDEASIGYNAYSVLHYGSDEYGKPFPFFFQAFGEYKSPIQIYFTVPFIALFGLNEFSTRIPSVIFGTLSIFAIYLLSKQLFIKYKYNSWIALLSSFFLAVSPWHIHFSRIAFEMMPFVLFTILGLYFFLKAKDSLKFLIICVASFSLALYSYFPARIFIPLFGLGIFCVYNKFFRQYKKSTITSLLLTLLLVPFIQHSISPSGLSRWQQINIFSQPPNDETVFQHILNNYANHFSLEFLFTKGDVNMPGQFLTRHSVKGMGELYFFQLPLIIFGFILLVRKKIYKPIILLLLWLILYPIGSMFTVDKSAQATRSIIGVIPFQILSAVGLCYLFILFSRLKKTLNYLFMLSILVIIFASFAYYLNLYFVKYPLYSSGYYGWQYGYLPIMGIFKSQSGNFDELLITHRFNYGEELLKFYNVTYACINCKVMFNPIYIDTTKKQLFAIRQDDINEAQKKYPHLSFNTQQTINLPNKETEFWIGTFTPK